MNKELLVAIAKLANMSGVFLNTMGVYGKGKALSAKESIIDEITPLNTTCGYGGIQY